MAVVTSGGVPHTRRPRMRSRNIALLSMVGVIGGTWLIFRMMAPQSGSYITTNEEMEAYRGSDSLQTDQGNRTARPPRKGFSVPRGSV